MGAGAFLSTTMAAPMFGVIAAIEFTDMPAHGYLPMFVAVVGAALAVRLWGIITNKNQRIQPFTSGGMDRRGRGEAVDAGVRDDVAIMEKIPNENEKQLFLLARYVRRG